MKAPIRMTIPEYLNESGQHTGICRGCGARRGTCEPDARDYPCDSCGEDSVYGLEELIVMGELEIGDGEMNQGDDQ
jgi:hypothetical protein